MKVVTQNQKIRSNIIANKEKSLKARRKCKHGISISKPCDKCYRFYVTN